MRDTLGSFWRLCYSYIQIDFLSISMAKKKPWLYPVVNEVQALRRDLLAES